MRKVYFDNVTEFYCPVTGVRLWHNDDDEFRGSPVTRFIYIEEPHLGFRYLDEAFAKAITKVAGPFVVDGKYDVYFRRLCGGMKGEKYVDFVLHCTWGIIHVGIDTVAPIRQGDTTQATAPVGT